MSLPEFACNPKFDGHLGTCIMREQCKCPTQPSWAAAIPRDLFSVADLPFVLFVGGRFKMVSSMASDG